MVRAWRQAAPPLPPSNAMLHLQGPRDTLVFLRFSTSVLFQHMHAPAYLRRHSHTPLSNHTESSQSQQCSAYPLETLRKAVFSI